MNKVSLIAITILLAFTGISTSYSQDIQRVRLDFEASTSFIRHLLLGFTPDNAANDGYNYGYDTLAVTDNPDDLNWIIDGLRCVGQGVGAFSIDKTYPFGMFIENPGVVSISLAELENFDQEIDVFIYDAETNEFSPINDVEFNVDMESGEYLNRFHITFQNTTPPNDDNNLFLNDYNIDRFIFKSIPKSKEIILDTRNELKINKVEILDILGRKVVDIKNIEVSKLRIPTHNINSNIVIVSAHTNLGIVRKKLLLF